MRIVLIVTLVLAFLAIPFLVWGELGAKQLLAWRDLPPSKAVVAGVTGLLLAGDIFLPIPSGPVMTFAGAQLGWLAATLVGWLGLTMGCVLAFALARRWGPPLAGRFCSPAELTAARSLVQSQGVRMLLATRPLPILAEAAVLTLGLMGAPWHTFLPTVAATNLVLATFYATLGQFAADREWLLPVLFIAAALPLPWLLRR